MYAEPTKPLDPDQLRRFCAAWADDGYDDPTGTYFVLFSGGDAEEQPEYPDMVEIGRDCGLEMELRDGGLWVRKIKQIDDEITAHWI